MILIGNHENFQSISKKIEYIESKNLLYKY